MSSLTAESVFILIIALGPVPLTRPISLNVSNKKIDAANPSAIADTSASGAEVAFEVCLRETHCMMLFLPLTGLTRYMANPDLLLSPPEAKEAST